MRHDDNPEKHWHQSRRFSFAPPFQFLFSHRISPDCRSLAADALRYECLRKSGTRNHRKNSRHRSRERCNGRGGKSSRSARHRRSPQGSDGTCREGGDRGGREGDRSRKDRGGGEKGVGRGDQGDRGNRSTGSNCNADNGQSSKHAEFDRCWRITHLCLA